MRRIAWEDHTAYRGAVELGSTGNSKKEHDMFNRFRFQARIRLIDGGSGEGGSGEGNEPEPKSFTQEQVDQIVEKRLAKERGKYKDYDKLKESNAALRKQIDDAAAEKQHAEWVSEVAKDKGVPAELLRGGTKEELEAHADLLQAALHPASKPPQVRNQTGAPSHQNNSKDAEELSYIHQLLGR